MELQACIFDLDGVIVDTARYHYIAWKEIATELGFLFTKEHNEMLKGVSRITSLEILLEVGNIKLTESRKTELANKKNNRYLEFVKEIKPDEILPGTSELLNDLRSHNIKIALGSASKNALAILKRLEITSLFDVIIDGNQVIHAKPNPEVFHKGAEALEVNPLNCIVIEDAQAGIDAALKGGMLPIGIGDPKVLQKASLVVPGLDYLNVIQLQKLLSE